jgi:hypothetical protein
VDLLEHAAALGLERAMVDARRPAGIGRRVEGVRQDMETVRKSGQSSQPLAREVLDEIMKRMLQATRYYYPVDANGQWQRHAATAQKRRTGIGPGRPPGAISTDWCCGVGQLRALR